MGGLVNDALVIGEVVRLLVVMEAEVTGFPLVTRNVVTGELVMTPEFVP